MLELPHANMHGLALTIKLEPAFAAAIWLQLGFWDHRDAEHAYTYIRFVYIWACAALRYKGCAISKHGNKLCTHAATLMQREN